MLLNNKILSNQIDVSKYIFQSVRICCHLSATISNQVTFISRYSVTNCWPFPLLPGGYLAAVLPSIFNQYFRFVHHLYIWYHKKVFLLNISTRNRCFAPTHNIILYGTHSKSSLWRPIWACSLSIFLQPLSTGQKPYLRLHLCRAILQLTKN